jgi:hypothetical protein
MQEKIECKGRTEYSNLQKDAYIFTSIWRNKKMHYLCAAILYRNICLKERITKQ